MTVQDIINVKEYVTDNEGHKTAVIIDIKEFSKLEKILEVIPASEKWLYENEEALTSVHQGLIDASRGRVSKLDPDSM